MLSENRFALYVLLLSDLLKSNPLLGIRRQMIPFCLHNSEHLIENACAICLSPITRFVFSKYSFVFPVMLLCCSRSKFLSKLLKTFDKTFREIFPVFISTKRREKPSAFFDNNFVNNAYFSEAASSSSSHLASSSSKAPISSRMTCLCLWSS